MDKSSNVIIGASLAGGRAAQALRAAGYDGDVVLIGAERELPYERPPLSKEYLRGLVPEANLYLESEEWYEQHDIEVRLGTRAVQLDPGAQTVQLATGESLTYDKLLIATGCNVRRLSISGSDLDGVCYLRNRAQADELAHRLRRAQHVVVIGAGFIGLEVAASTRMLGHEVTVLQRGSVPLERVLGERMGRVCAALHRDHGVDLRLSCKVDNLRGHGRVEEIVLSDGTRLPCDLVVVGIGVRPSVGWLEGSGIEVDNGILVDEYTETNVPGVHAAGDVANSWNPLLRERLRIEHYDNAQGQGMAAGRAMAGLREPYAPVPYFWSDQFDLTLQYIGHARPDDELIVRGDPDALSFTAFYMRDGGLRAAFGIGRPRDITAVRRLLRSRDRVDPRTLANEYVDLRHLSRQETQ